MTKQEGFKQAAYDMGTAQIIFDAGRRIYTVFMCHLAIEKALKGLYQVRLGKTPPKVHNLVYLAERIGLSLPGGLHDFMIMLNRLSIPTRYPDELGQALRKFGKKRTQTILDKSKELLKWLKSQSRKPSGSCDNA